MHYHRHKCLIDSVVEMDIFRTKSALIRPPRILTLATKETLSGKLLGMLQMGTLIIFMLETTTDTQFKGCGEASSVQVQHTS